MMKKICIEMKRSVVNSITLFLAVMITQQLVAQTDRFGQMIYTTPAGWTAHKFQDGVALLPTPLPSGEKLFIQILQAKNISTSLEGALELSYDEVCAMLNASKMREVSGSHYSAKEPKKSFRGWEYIRCSGGIQINNGTPYPDEFGLDMFVIKVNNRFERIAIVKSRNTCNGLSRYYPSDRTSYHNTIENFLFSLKFADWKEPDVIPGTIKRDGISGVWQGLSMSVGIAKPGAELGAELKVKQLILFSNGQAYFGKNFPAVGLDEVNTWIMAENNRRDWGTYTFAKGNGMLKLPYAEMPLRMENDNLIITSNKTDHGFIKTKPVDGARFNGTYTLSEWNGKIPSITFTSDGKFTDNGALAVLYHEYVDCLNSALKVGSGTYAVKNNSVIFEYTDGRKIRIALTGSGFDPGNPSPGELVLSFNEDKLVRQ
jgi:hypothetical protein